jgi:exopolysaccharide biosynthesis protein
MKKIIITILLLIIIFLIHPFSVQAASLGQKLSGQILLNVEGNGEAWYINPKNNLRYYLGRPEDAFKVMRELGLGINEIDFQKIAQAGMPILGDIDLANRLKGRIVIQTERNGEAWYIYPKDLKKYYLGRPEDAFKVMRELSLGITKRDLALIHKPGTEESINQYSKYEHKKINTSAGEFLIDLITIDLANPKLRIITDTADTDNCKTNCLANPLIDYALNNKAFAAINGTYFDTDNSKKNYYFFPVYNSNLNKLINEDQLKYWTTGPIMVFDKNNKFYYFKDSREFKSVADFENIYNTKIQAALGNKPRLVEKGMNLLIDWDIDIKQKTLKTLRNAIGYKNNKIYLVIASKATIPDLAIIMQALDVEYALNLDGGYSSALFYNDEYMVSPGRNIPNALVFAESN